MFVAEKQLRASRLRASAISKAKKPDHPPRPHGFGRQKSLLELSAHRDTLAKLNKALRSNDLPGVVTALNSLDQSVLSRSSISSAIGRFIFASVFPDECSVTDLAGYAALVKVSRSSPKYFAKRIAKIGLDYRLDPLLTMMPPEAIGRVTFILNSDIMPDDKVTPPKVFWNLVRDTSLNGGMLEAYVVPTGFVLGTDRDRSYDLPNLVKPKKAPVRVLDSISALRSILQE